MKTAIVILTLATVGVASAAPPPGEAKKIDAKETRRGFHGVLAEGDAKHPLLDRQVKTIPLRIVKGSMYVLELSSKDFDPLLLVTASDGKEVTRNDNAGKDTPAARITLFAPRDDEYQFIVASADGKFGGYSLFVTPQGRPGDPGVLFFEGDVVKDASREFKLAKDRAYTIDVLSVGFPIGIQLVDAKGKSVAVSERFEDNPARAHIEFTPESDGAFQLRLAASAGAKGGAYLLHVVERRAAGALLALGKDGLLVEDEWTIDDPRDKKRKSSPCKTYTVQLFAGKAYAVNLHGMGIDTFLRIEDAKGVQLAQDDDSGDGADSRILFTPKTDGPYVVCATTFGRDHGAFRLSIVETIKKK